MTFNAENPFAQRSTLEYELPPFADIRDEHYLPAYNWVKKIWNILLLGQHKKRYIPKQQESYFRKEVAERNRLYAYAKGHLTVD